MRRRSFIAALAVVLSFTGHLSAQLVFDDGGSHTLTGDVKDAVYVSNQTHLTIDATELNKNVYVNNATVDHLNGGMQWPNRWTISNHSLFNSHVQGEASYDIIDSEVNFYAGHSAMSQSILAGGTSIVRLLDGRYVDVLRETISLRGEAQLFVSAKSQVRIPIFMRGSSHGQATNALIASLNLSGSASFDVQGGILSDANWDDNWSDRSLRLFDDARFTMTGGTISSFDSFPSPMIKTHQRSQVVLRDVQNGDGISFFDYGGVLFHSTDESLIQIDSGQFQVQLDISGLNITAALSLLEDNSNSVVNGGQFRISGGGVFGDSRLDIFELRGTSHVLITGGEFIAIARTEDAVPSWSPHIVFATQQSRADILGGTFNLSFETSGDGDGFIRQLDARDSATITLHGSGFNYPLGPVSDLEGTITGFLLDGSPIDWNFLRDSTAHIVLVPEPSAKLLFLGGSALLAIQRRRGGNRYSAAVT